jgi:hypothetical protein
LRHAVLVEVTIPKSQLLMRHFKFMGWLWILLGGFWSLLSLYAQFTSPSDENSALSRSAWWENTILGILEVAVFVGSAACGFALLRRWRSSRPFTWILGGIWLFFSGLVICGADGPLIGRLVWCGPSLAIAVYSLIVLAFAKSQIKAA